MIVVGSVNVDLVIRASRLPRPGETVMGGDFARHHGGKGGNQAVAAARLGAPTLLVGALGDDDLAAGARTALESDGVAIDELGTMPGSPTGVALIVVDPEGDNLIAVAPGANGAVTPELVRAALQRLAPGRGDVVLAGLEVPTLAAREALLRGRSGGATTILNPAPATGLDRGVLGLVDVLTPNRGELVALVAAEARRTGRSGGISGTPVDGARMLVERSSEGEGPQAVLVSLGRDGGLLVRRGLPPLDLPAPVVEAVDATGAGDALNGALAAGLAAGLDLATAAHRAVVAATASTLAPGAREGLVRADALERLLAT